MSKKITLVIENVTPELGKHLVKLLKVGEGEINRNPCEEQVDAVIKSLESQLQARKNTSKPTEEFIRPSSAANMAVRMKRFLNREAVLASFEEACEIMGGGRWCDDMTMKEFLEVFAPNGIRFHAAKTTDPGPLSLEEVAKLLARMEAAESPQKDELGV